MSDTLGGEAEQTVSCGRIHLARKEARVAVYFSVFIPRKTDRFPVERTGEPEEGLRYYL